MPHFPVDLRDAVAATPRQPGESLWDWLARVSRKAAETSRGSEQLVGEEQFSRLRWYALAQRYGNEPSGDPPPGVKQQALATIRQFVTEPPQVWPAAGGRP